MLQIFKNDACYFLKIPKLPEKSEQPGVYLVADLTEVLLAVLETAGIHVDDEQFSLVLGNPLLVAVVEALEVVDADAVLVLAAALLDLLHEVRNRRAQVDQQVGIAHHLLHQLEEGGVVVEVAGVHQSHVVQVRREYHRVLVDGAVLDDVLPRVLELHDVLEPLVEEVHLEVE